MSVSNQIQVKADETGRNWARDVQPRSVVV